ncbi:MAG: TraR/DksA family transcriptional regulator [Desulfuromonadaceae bacterium]
MATKTKATKESASKAASSSPAAAKKSDAQSLKTPVTLEVSAPVEAPKPVKSASKAKPHPQAEVPELKQKSAESVEKPAKNMVTAVQAAVGQSAPPASAVATQDQRWQEIKLILEKLKEDTLREIRKSVKNGTEAVAAIEPGGDIYDQASSERDRELGLLLGDREREKIHSIDEALLRIDEGEYGICEECDEDIPLGRLKAMPFTRHCVKCKSDLEKLQAQTKRVEEERAYREIPLGAEEEE